MNTQKADDRSQAVLYAVTHFTRQKGLVIESFLKLGVGMLTLDCNSEQTGKAGQEIGIGVIELSGIWTVSF